ncbi:hypothetical protein, partial [Lentimonas sp. CC10]|uniref:hypothetical protein n=1 Tax=Lentimonas sp. CC10 TaxID=2676095 RepID=UPI001A7EC0F7
PVASVLASTVAVVDPASASSRQCLCPRIGCSDATPVASVLASSVAVVDLAGASSLQCPDLGTAVAMNTKKASEHRRPL